MKMLQELCAAFLFPSQLPENRYCTSSWTLKAGCWLPFPLQHASSHIFIYFFISFVNWDFFASFSSTFYEVLASPTVSIQPSSWSQPISIDFRTLDQLWVPHTPRSQAMIMQLWRCTGQRCPVMVCSVGICWDGWIGCPLEASEHKKAEGQVWLDLAKSCCDLNLTKHSKYAFFQANWLRQLQKAGDSDGFSSFGQCISVLQTLQAFQAMSGNLTAHDIAEMPRTQTLAQSIAKA